MDKLLRRKEDRTSSRRMGPPRIVTTKFAAKLREPSLRVVRTSGDARGCRGEPCGPARSTGRPASLAESVPSAGGAFPP